jgi:hypothetical protein
MKSSRIAQELFPLLTLYYTTAIFGGAGFSTAVNRPRKGKFLCQTGTTGTVDVL